MRRTPESSQSRGGFTLVELLVVITIIGILAALISAAVIKAVGKGDEVKLRNEVMQLTQAVTAFKQQYAVGYMPDRLILPPAADTSGATQQYLKSVWPRLSPATLGSTNFTLNGTPYTPFSYWQVPGSTAVTLQGDQCLVFWLGGPRDTQNNCLGWSSDGTDPMKQTGSRVGPFYAFPSGRLVAFAGTGRTTAFPSFVDTIGLAPYLYFSTNRADNSYQSNITLTAGTVYPYLLSGNVTTPRWVNPSSFQIISAGKDGAFGNGLTEWAGYTPNGGSSQTGFDDVANFHPTHLGSPSN
jgi:prepilin-type N-terminal cleavage/methylation domain-containing protein